jgi:hypothetical protein
MKSCKSTPEQQIEIEYPSFPASPNPSPGGDGWRRSLSLGLLFASLCLPARAQTYAINWWSIDAGGGTSTGGVYQVRGTIGQPDAGVMTNDTYVLQGGFWGGAFAVQTPAAPQLNITRNNTAVIVWWVAPADGWLLHTSTNLGASGNEWTEVPPPYETTAATNLFFTEPFPLGRKFYRLHRP